MIPEFTPKWPRSISGRGYRLPLDQESYEALGERLDAIYRKPNLRDADRGLLIKLYADLVRLDGFKQEQPPHRVWSGTGSLGEQTAHNQAWVKWLAGTITMFEART